jgi:hypothetical protein
LVNTLKTIEKIEYFTLFLEQYLILLFNPEYNVLKVAGSSAGRTFSSETIEKMRNAA